MPSFKLMVLVTVNNGLLKLIIIVYFNKKWTVGQIKQCLYAKNESSPCLCFDILASELHIDARRYRPISQHFLLAWPIYAVKSKTAHCTFACKFAQCYPVLKVVSLA